MDHPKRIQATKWIFIVIAVASVALLPFGCDAGKPHYSSREELLLEIHSQPFIPANYNMHELPPKRDGQTTEMTFSVLIMGVRDIKEISEEISIEMNMYMQWYDTRLNSKFLVDEDSKKQNFVVLKPKLLEEIWHPDIFFENLKAVMQPAVVTAPASLRIYNDSALRYSQRVLLTTHCEMRFENYPLDTQRCNVDLKSYGYNDKQLLLYWYKDGARFGQNIALANFFLGLDKPTYFSFTSSSGTFPGLRFTVSLSRKFGYHLIQTYIPSALLVVVSWLSFLVPASQVPGRMAICVTCLLTLIAMFASVRQMVPNVSYIKALDIWMVCCVFFVFLALAEFTTVLKFINLKDKKNLSAAASINAENGTTILEKRRDINYGKVADALEDCAPIVIAMFFGLFNLVYWTWLLAARE